MESQAGSYIRLGVVIAPAQAPEEEEAGIRYLMSPSPMSCCEPLLDLL